MKLNKNKHILVFVLSLLSIAALVGCSNTPASSGGSSDPVDPPVVDPEDPPVDPENEDTVYKITYYLSGGTLDKPNPSTYTKKTETFTLNNPHKDGYYFLGWSSTFLDSIQQTVTIVKGTTGNLHFTANFTYVGEVEYLNGKTISLLPDPVATLWNCETEHEVAKFLYEYEESYVTASSAKPLDINYMNITKAEEVDVNLYNDEDCTDLAYTQHVSNPNGKTDGKATFYNILPNQAYYVKVIDSSNGNILKEDSFVIEEKIRFINCGSVMNMRDMGGKETPSGTTPYGKVFRSADMSYSATNRKAVDVLVNQLHIKTEIDLRLDRDESSNNPSMSPDESINLVHCGYWHCDYIFPDFNKNRPFSSTYAENLKKAFLLFTEEENYPITFHCSAGADRTGTFAFLLDGLLGVDYESLCRDYETTSFYMTRRWRSSIDIVDGVYSFNPSGVMQDDTANLVSFGKMYNHMLEAYGAEDGTLSSAIANYMKEVVGLSDENIAAIKQNILGDSAN